MRPSINKIFTLLFSMLFLCTITASCDSGSPLPTVDGPEEDTLLRGTNGWLLVDGPNGNLIGISFPDLKRETIRYRTPISGAVYAISGPDKSGRIVYVETHMMAKKHLLKIRDLSGSTEMVIFERPGDAIWDRVIGEDIAISPSGERVAFVGKYSIPYIDPPNWHEKAGILKYGPLEVWRVATQTQLITNVKAVDRGISWFPDNKSLAYTTLLPRGQVLKEQTHQEIGGGFESWSQIPVVMILNVTDGTSRFLHVGWRPVISPDGKAVLVSDLHKQNWLVDVTTKQSQSVTLPGDWGGPFAFVSENLVLYAGLPTTGSKQEWTIRNSPLVGRKSMGTLKVADIRTGRFKTVLSPVDPRWQVSFGRPARP